MLTPLSEAEQLRCQTAMHALSKMNIFKWFKRAEEASDNPEEQSDTPLPAKRLTDDLWVRLVDLPGYREWAADYDRLERIIPNLEEYYCSVRPEHVKQPPSGYFERKFQGHLDAWDEHLAHLNLPRYTLEDYKQGGRLSV